MSLVKDPIIEEIKVLYDLGEGGQYEIIQRTIAIFRPLLELGWSAKKLVDRMMDKGVKSLELGIPVLTTTELAEAFVKTLEWLQKNKPTINSLEPYDELN